MIFSESDVSKRSVCCPSFSYEMLVPIPFVTAVNTVFSGIWILDVADIWLMSTSPFNELHNTYISRLQFISTVPEISSKVTCDVFTSNSILSHSRE